LAEMVRWRMDVKKQSLSVLTSSMGLLSASDTPSYAGISPTSGPPANAVYCNSESGLCSGCRQTREEEAGGGGGGRRKFRFVRKLLDCGELRSNRKGRKGAFGVIHKRLCVQKAAGKNSTSRKGAAPFLVHPPPAEFSDLRCFPWKACYRMGYHLHVSREKHSTDYQRA